MSTRMTAFTAACSLALFGLLAHPTAGQTPSPAVAAAVADPGRPDADTKRDANRHPGEILTFAGVRPGMQVVEFSPGGGYFTRLLAKAVGPKGHVYALYMANLGDRGSKGANDVAAANPNVSAVAQTGPSLPLPGKVDLAWVTDNYHDYFNPGFGGGMDMAAFDKAVFDALKPGGVFLLVDYQSAPGAGATQTGTLHRMEESVVKSRLTAAGFVVDGESQVLNNPKDDHTLRIFDPAVRGEADQYVIRFRKPR
jgi:predicted methyltransferase